MTEEERAERQQQWEAFREQRRAERTDFFTQAITDAPDMEAQERIAAQRRAAVAVADQPRAAARSPRKVEETRAAVTEHPTLFVTFLDIGQVTPNAFGDQVVGVLSHRAHSPDDFVVQ